MPGSDTAYCKTHDRRYSEDSLGCPLCLVEQRAVSQDWKHQMSNDNTQTLSSTAPLRKKEDFTAGEVSKTMAEFGISEPEARISLERRQVYGDPYQNHYGIAQSWAGLLQVWALRIARGDPIPSHVVALMLAALKTNRCRLKFHQDNFEDANVYLAFARVFQQRWEREGGEAPTPDPMAAMSQGKSDFVMRLPGGPVHITTKGPRILQRIVRVPSVAGIVGQNAQIDNANYLIKPGQTLAIIEENSDNPDPRDAQLILLRNRIALLRKELTCSHKLLLDDGHSALSKSDKDSFWRYDYKEARAAAEHALMPPNREQEEGVNPK